MPKNCRLVPVMIKFFLITLRSILSTIEGKDLMTLFEVHWISLQTGRCAYGELFS